MADKKISDLTAVTSLDDGDLFELENTGGNSRRVAFSSVRSSLGGLATIARATPTGTNTYTFSSIPGTYTDLVLVVVGRSAAAVVNDAIQIRANSLSTAIYDRQRTFSNSTTTTSDASNGQTSMEVGGLAGTSATSGVVGATRVEILNYADTNFNKAILANYRIPQGGSGSAYVVMLSGEIRTTGAITSLEVAVGGSWASGGNYVSGSVLTLYGRG